MLQTEELKAEKKAAMPKILKFPQLNSLRQRLEESVKGSCFF